ncbi:hypothetical protein ACP70R_011500 [Stipagrostis hirtigluma subsp. patula]
MLGALPLLIMMMICQSVRTACIKLWENKRILKRLRAEKLTRNLDSFSGAPGRADGDPIVYYYDLRTDHAWSMCMRNGQ